MKHTRRNFIKQSGLWLASSAPMMAGLSALTSQAFAAASQPNSDFNFVLFNLQGGADSVVSLHPWLDANPHSAKELYLNYPISPRGNIDGTQISLGPAAFSLFPYVRQMAIVRGMYMGGTEVGHPKAIQHMAAGRDQESAPHMLAHFGSKFADKERFLLTNLTPQMGTVKPFPIIEIKSLRKQGDLSKMQSTSALDLYQDSELPVTSYLNLLKQKNKLAQYQEIIAQQQNNGEVYDETYALAGLVTGLSRVVQIDFYNSQRDLDTHGGHSQHIDFQRDYWMRIAAFLKVLTEKDLMKKTLVMVTTEFNRTPGLNLSEGKDHNYFDNSVAFFGRNVNGGRVIGDHTLHTSSANIETAYWAGKFLNYKTGEVMENRQIMNLKKPDSKLIETPHEFDLIRPMNVWATVAENLSPGLSKEISFDAELIPGLFKKS